MRNRAETGGTGLSDNEIMQRAVWKYGPAAQEVKAIEELSELSQAICKVIEAHKKESLNNLVDCVAHMFEEMADVEIMLAQLKIIYSDAEREVGVWKSKKLQRLAIRMGVRK